MKGFVCSGALVSIGLLLAACSAPPLSASPSPVVSELGVSGVQALSTVPNGNWTASGKIYSNGQRFDVRGVNIFGIEEAGALHGSWSYQTDRYIARVAALGFNAIRLPVSHETIQPGFTSTYDINLGGSYGRKQSLDVIWDVVKAAKANNIAVVLDYQTCKNTLIGGNLPALPYGGPCSTDRSGWLSDLRRLADIAAAMPNVMGVDIYNEPRYGGDEARYLSDAKAAADAIHGVAPGTLIFVSGLEQANNWGEDLHFALRYDNPLNDYDSLKKIVYSAHIYKINAPDDDSAGWNRVIKAVRDAGKTVVIGEFGFDPGQQWGQNLVNYMKTNDLRDSFYWSFNADDASLGLIKTYTGEAGGPTKPQYDVVKGLFGDSSPPPPLPPVTPPVTPPVIPPPPPVTPPVIPPPPPGVGCKVIYRVQNAWTGGATINVEVSNIGKAAIDGWTLTFKFAGNQRITDAWNGRATQSGQNVSLKNVDYNASIAPGASQAPGFNLGFSGNNAAPTGFELNGKACQ